MIHSQRIWGVSIDMTIYSNSPTVNLVKAGSPRGKYLLFLRCGSEDINIDIVELLSEYDIDIVISYFSKPSQDFKHPNLWVLNGGLSKYHAFKSLWDEEHSIRNYDSYAFFDADLVANSRTISLLFKDGGLHQLQAWHPSLCDKSHTRWSFLGSQKNSHEGLRYTNFIEVMCPFFSNEGLKKCVKTFSESISTWGLDYAWSSLISESDMAVIDNHSISHYGKPDLKGGAFYQYLASIGINPKVELWKLRFRYNKIFFKPSVSSSYQKTSLSKWINALKSSDNDYLVNNKDSCLNDGSKFVYFLNHFSILKISSCGVEPRENNTSYVDGGLLRKQLRLKGPRISFDFSGIADAFFKNAQDNNVLVVTYGGTEKSAQEFNLKIREDYPRLRILSFSGYLSNSEIIQHLNDLLNSEVAQVILGLGSPRQEILSSEIGDNVPNVDKIYTCGGFITQTAMSDVKIFYPKFIDKFGLRWIWRISKEPHVLRRVIFDYPRSIWHILKN